jgi:hypothetical protein
LCGCPLRTLAQIPLRLHGDDLADRRWVVREVRAASGAHLDHAPAQACEQPSAMLGAAATLTSLCDLRIDSREHRMGSVLRHW